MGSLAGPIFSVGIAHRILLEGFLFVHCVIAGDTKFALGNGVAGQLKKWL